MERWVLGFASSRRPTDGQMERTVEGRDMHIGIGMGMGMGMPVCLFSTLFLVCIVACVRGNWFPRVH